MRTLFHSLLTCSLLLAASGLTADSLDTQRPQFLKAEQLLARNNIPEFLEALERIPDYPLYPYLKYQWLKKNLTETADIIRFLERFPHTRYGDLLRGKWLNYLAEQQNWSDISRYYQTTDATDLQCLYQHSLYVAGQKATALAVAKELWLSGEALPSQCDYLLMAFRSSSEFNTPLVWQRFELALQKQENELAAELIELLPSSEQATAKFWLQTHETPTLIGSPEFNQIAPSLQARIFAHAIQRQARKSPSYAALLWDAKKSQLNIDKELQAQVERNLALALAKNKNLGAFSHLMQLQNPDEEVHEWRLRAALQEQNWSHISQAFQVLPESEKTEPRWQYWYARALMEQGQKTEAETHLRQIANKRDYYGYLAADYLDLDYSLADAPLVVPASTTQSLLASDDIKLIQELRYLQRDHEAQAQWWYLLKKLDHQQIGAAAKLAEQWQWKHVAIFTIAKAEYWDDVNLRFPLYHQDDVKQYAATQELDPAVVFGLIRQESAFNEVATSPVGAKGLMQIMPSTGNQIARELAQPLSSANKLYNPSTNIQFGSFYYKKLLQRFDGNYVLATAAYNAGPHRVDSWLPKEGSIAADIWVELIPFNETRKYVAAVLSYALIYQQRLQRDTLKMSSFFQSIDPQIVAQKENPSY